MGYSISICPSSIFPHHSIVAKFGKAHWRASKGAERLRAVSHYRITPELQYAKLVTMLRMTICEGMRITGEISKILFAPLN